MLVIFKVKYTAAFRNKHVHNCIAQFKTGRRITTASAGSIPQLLQMIVTSHRPYARERWHTTHATATTKNWHFIGWPMVC